MSTGLRAINAKHAPFGRKKMDDRNLRDKSTLKHALNAGKDAEEKKNNDGTILNTAR